MSDDDSEILFRRKRRHARAQAKSVDRRKARRAPRRDDVARAALFSMLMQCRKTEHDKARAAFRKALLEILSDAGFDPDEAGRVFDAMVSRVGIDLDRYLVQRGIGTVTRNAWRRTNDLDVLPDQSAADGAVSG